MLQRLTASDLDWYFIVSTKVDTGIDGGTHIELIALQVQGAVQTAHALGTILCDRRETKSRLQCHLTSGRVYLSQREHTCSYNMLYLDYPPYLVMTHTKVNKISDNM